MQYLKALFSLLCALCALFTIYIHTSVQLRELWTVLNASLIHTTASPKFMDPHSIKLVVVLVDVGLDWKIGSWAIILLLFFHVLLLLHMLKLLKQHFLEKCYSPLKIRKKVPHIPMANWQERLDRKSLYFWTLEIDILQEV